MDKVFNSASSEFQTFALAFEESTISPSFQRIYHGHFVTSHFSSRLCSSTISIVAFVVVLPTLPESLILAGLTEKVIH